MELGGKATNGSVSNLNRGGFIPRSLFRLGLDEWRCRFPGSACVPQAVLGVPPRTSEVSAAHLTSSGSRTCRGRRRHRHACAPQTKVEYALHDFVKYGACSGEVCLPDGSITSYGRTSRNFRCFASRGEVSSSILLTSFLYPSYILARPFG